MFLNARPFYPPYSREILRIQVRGFDQLDIRGIRHLTASQLGSAQCFEGVSIKTGTADASENRVEQIFRQDRWNCGRGGLHVGRYGCIERSEDFSHCSLTAFLILEIPRLRSE